MSDNNESHNLAVRNNLEEVIRLHKLWVDSNGSKGTQLVLKGLDLTGADFEGSNLNLANFKNTDFSGADLSGSYLKTANLDGAKLPILPRNISRFIR